MKVWEGCGFYYCLGLSQPHAKRRYVPLASTLVSGAPNLFFFDSVCPKKRPRRAADSWVALSLPKSSRSACIGRRGRGNGKIEKQKKERARLPSNGKGWSEREQEEVEREEGRR